MGLLQEVIEAALAVRKSAPLIHHITNYVTANDSANITLAIGASPVMAGDPDEVAEVTARSSALVLNLGTPNPRSIAAMVIAGKKARERAIPIIVDPVGVGATAFRKAAFEQLVHEVPPAVIRGNLSEVKAILGLPVIAKGVDSTETGGDAGANAVALSQQLGCVVAVTGQVDVIADGDRVCRLQNGHPWLTHMTGAGCMAASLVASCCGAGASPFAGTVAGLGILGVAAEVAHSSLKPDEGIGTFRMRLFDAVFQLTAATLERTIRFSEVKGGR
ncbi:MAG: hydroxyethylthiazole kinase [Negativicutes bacterium]|nr:hydroxyethylthiazole kinase [Negativicutes bacterium]